MLELNRRFQLDAPQGTITVAGIHEIRLHLQRQSLRRHEAWVEKNPDTKYHYLPALPESWRWTWVVTGRGEYVGTFPKRVSKYYYKQFGIKCPPPFLQELGNIARRHCEDNLHYDYEFVDTFDWQAGDFGDRGSCYWGSNREAREVMRNEGGLAIRFYEDGNGFARAWIAPLHDQKFIVFNGYGFPTYPTLTCTRVLSLHTGLSYKRIDLDNHGTDTGLLYINSGRGFLVASTVALENFGSHHDLQWGAANYCAGCHDPIEDDVYYGPDGHGQYCENCFYDTYESCERCGEVVYRENIYVIANGSEYVCEYCHDRHYTTCDGCDESYRHELCTEVGDRIYCRDCLPDNTYVCKHCEEIRRNETECTCQQPE